MSKGNKRKESFLSKHSSKLTIVFVLTVMFVGIINLSLDKKVSFPDCVNTPKVQIDLYDKIYSIYEKSSGDIKQIDLTLIEDKPLEKYLKRCTVKAETKLKDDSLIVLNIEYNISWSDKENNLLETIITQVD